MAHLNENCISRRYIHKTYYIEKRYLSIGMMCIHVHIWYVLDLVKHFVQVFVWSKTLIWPLCFVLRKATVKEAVTHFFLGNSSYLKKMKKTVFENWCNSFLIDSHLFFLVGGKWKLQLYCIVKLILHAIFIQLLNAACASCQELSPISPPAQNFNVLEAVKCSNRKNIHTGFSQRL